MKYLSAIIKKVLTKKNLSKNSSKPLGRWNVENCKIKINRKIDLSNEDHCGPCGQYTINKSP